MIVRRYLTERLRDSGSDRALCSAPLPPPPLWAVWTTTTWTGWPAACRPPATGPSWRRCCAVRRRRCRRRGETGGGGREARGIPGRGEEDEYRGRKVQGGVDEAQRGRQQWRLGPGRGPGGWGRAQARRAMAMAGDWMTLWRMPPRHVSERGVSPPAPCRLPRTHRRRWLRRWGLKVEE
jgi:hypothetical protein